MRVSLLRSQIVLAALCATAFTSQPASAQGQQQKPLPAGTAIPIRFTRDLTAHRIKPGEPVRAVTTEEIQLPEGRRIPAGSVVLGEVVEAKAFHFDSAPYAHQQPSTLAIRFERVETPAGSLPLNVTTRALASPGAVRSVDHVQETDGLGPETEARLIGGPVYSTLEPRIVAANGDAIAYRKAQGVVARLAASSDPQTALVCNAGESEQAVGVFAPTACGAYGFDGAALAGGEQASLTLEETGHTARIGAGSLALLEAR
jgi:hypothetical protein